jgi:hypothetical protein
MKHCAHIKADGNICQAPNLKNEDYCYFHIASRDRIRRQREAAERNLPLQIPVLEDKQTIQLALGDVANALLSDRIDPRKAALVLYALQTASANARDLDFVSDRQWYNEYSPDTTPPSPNSPMKNQPSIPPRKNHPSAPPSERATKGEFVSMGCQQQTRLRLAARIFRPTLACLSANQDGAPGNKSEGGSNAAGSAFRATGLER